MTEHPAAPPDSADPLDPATVLLDTGGTVTGWSDGAARLFGRTAAEALGTDLPALLRSPAAAARSPPPSRRPRRPTLDGNAPAVRGHPRRRHLRRQRRARRRGRRGPRHLPGPHHRARHRAGRRRDGRIRHGHIRPDARRAHRRTPVGGRPGTAERGREPHRLHPRPHPHRPPDRRRHRPPLRRCRRHLRPGTPPGRRRHAPGRARDDGSIVVRRLAVAFADDDPGDWAAAFPAGEVVVHPPATPYARCVATGRTVEFGGEDALDSLARRTGRLVDGVLDHTSLLAVPLTARGRALGYAVFSRKHGRAPFGPADAALAAELAARAATGIDNACLYRREHRTATALQAGLLPTRVTVPPGLRIAHRYRPARAAVGGDWYDVVPLPDERVAIVIGDSVGHGVTAAAAMGQLRVAAHTLVSCELPPAEVLARLDAIAQDLDAAQFATCLCLVCDPATLRCELACAGHPPPLVTLPDGTARHFAVADGLPLGVADPAHPAEYEQVSAVLPPGGVLAFYTDGLVESRLRNIEEGIARLASALVASHTAGGSLEDTADGTLALLADQQGQDDIALLLVSPEPR
ncbi:SpoIIE family protein phosphatase [Actinomadura sp. CNU-125]|uniref:SpoIIE family protein phosphatase n=1 Tax=Actinomadura sp. CNU-125 TaxID=1904961 RepID=UPI0009F9FF8D|nr:SpoIIE family protein phosphatase [Actinomadura sp. CNU-125]